MPWAPPGPSACGQQRGAEGRGGAEPGSGVLAAKSRAPCACCVLGQSGRSGEQGAVSVTGCKGHVSVVGRLRAAQSWLLRACSKCLKNSLSFKMRIWKNLTGLPGLVPTARWEAGTTELGALGRPGWGRRERGAAPVEWRGPCAPRLQDDSAFSVFLSCPQLLLQHLEAGC